MRAIIIEREPDDILLSLLQLVTALHVLAAMKSISADCKCRSIADEGTASSSRQSDQGSIPWPTPNGCYVLDGAERRNGTST
jgi:hypothetical protein